MRLESPGHQRGNPRVTIEDAHWAGITTRSVSEGRTYVAAAGSPMGPSLTLRVGKNTPFYPSASIIDRGFCPIYC
jgi:hypothetical protein